MPVLPVSHPGVTFYVFHLEGTLRYTIARQGKPAREYELCGQDFDDNDAVIQDSFAVKVGLGIDASAVGIQLCVTKNDAVLSMAFEGKDGSGAEWIFEGMDEVTKGPRVASAATQTVVDASNCSICGADKLKRVAMSDGEAQTEAQSMQDGDTQTEKQDARNATTQTNRKYLKKSRKPSMLTEASVSENPVGLSGEEGAESKLEDTDKD